MSSKDEARDRLKTILSISIPIVGGMVSQNVLNLVDMFMVSKIAEGRENDIILAAVGQGSFASFMLASMVLGLSAGVQAIVARRYGENRPEKSIAGLSGGIAWALILGVPWSIFLYFFATDLFPLFNADPEVQAVGSGYLQMRVIGYTALGMNFAFRGFWNGLNLSWVYMRTLWVMHLSNIILNYVLIFGFWKIEAMGAKGAGLGTALSLFIGAAYYIYLAIKLDRQPKRFGFTHAKRFGILEHIIPSVDELRTVFRLSLPNSIQQFLFAAGFNVLFYIINMLGSQEGAVANVLMTLVMVAILPGLGLGITAASLVGQALGRKDVDDARRWGNEVIVVAIGVMFVLGLPGVFFPELLLGAFIDNPQTLELGIWPLRILSASIAIDAVGMVLINALNGAGATTIAAGISVGFQWLLFLPAAYLVGPVLGYGLLAIYIAQVIYRSLQSVVFILIWRTDRWTTVKV